MRSLRIGFTSPQGGAGVSVLTIAVASRLHYYHRIPVAVADCDIKKHSCVVMREGDDVEKAPTRVYDIIAMTPGEIGSHEIVEGQKSLSEGGEGPKVTLFDLGGSMDSGILSKMDYVYIPIVKSYLIGNGIQTVLQTAEEFYKARSDTRFRLFLNKCKPYGPERLWDLVSESGMTPCDQILIAEARVLKRRSLSEGIYHEKTSIPTTENIDHFIMTDARLYNLESLILKDINRPRLWKRQ